MNKSFTIDPEKREDYIKKQMKTIFTVMIAVMGSISLFVIIAARFALFSFGIVAFLSMIGSLVYFISRSGRENLANSIQFTVTEDAVIQNFNKSELDGLTSAGMELNSMRFGTKFTKVFPFSKIENTEITENEIIVTSTDFSFMGDNNTIKIPKECKNYDELIIFIKENPTKFKLSNGRI